MLASLCRLDMQTGSTELAVARLQANLEYSCFPAPVMAGELGMHMWNVNVWQAGYLKDSCHTPPRTCHARGGLHAFLMAQKWRAGPPGAQVLPASVMAGRSVCSA